MKACQINYHYIDAKTLLVNVEEITGNYSSAVCYVNELLEVNPYWKGLWLRKVDLYKKMGNFEEANTLLRRLAQIYPNDASINSDYFDVLETTYQQALEGGDSQAAEDALKEIVRITPTDSDYQLAYANILIRRGKLNDALENLTAAIGANPGNVPLENHGYPDGDRAQHGSPFLSARAAGPASFSPVAGALRAAPLGECPHGK